MLEYADRYTTRRLAEIAAQAVELAVLGFIPVVQPATPPTAEPPGAMINLAADLITDGKFTAYETLKAQHPAYDWAGCTDQRSSYRHWKNPPARPTVVLNNGMFAGSA